MPRESYVETLKRWMALDAELAGLGDTGGGLDVKSFAEAHGVSTRAVYRDIEVFEALEQDVEQERPPDVPGGRRVHRYDPFTARCLFTENQALLDVKRQLESAASGSAASRRPGGRRAEEEQRQLEREREVVEQLRERARRTRKQ
jgi:hypothetical protein